MTAHARLGPSAADRWMTCSASVELIQSLADRGIVDPSASSVYADEGTAAHEVRQISLELGVDPHDFIGRTIYVGGAPYPVTHEMADFLQPGIDWIREHTDAPDVEIRVDLSPWLPKQFGTLDAGFIVGRSLYLSDLKFGMGENVSPDANNQQMLYALGYWHFKGRPTIRNIVICIDQPRLGGLKFWECDFETLMAFSATVEAAYAKIISGETEFMPTPKGCRWCKAKDAVPAKGYTGCPAYNQKQLDVFMGAFDDLDAEPNFPETLTPERRAYVVEHAAEARKWLAAQHENSLQAALNGTPDPGLKAVIGQRGNRFYTNEVAAEAVLVGAVGDDAYQPKQIVGITAAEKLLKPGKKRLGNPEAWEALNLLVDQPDGKPILVPVSDPRQAVTPLTDQFDDL